MKKSEKNLEKKIEGSIPFEKLTYGDLIIQIQTAILQICTNFKLQKNSKKKKP